MVQEGVPAGADALVMDARDDVATALKDLKAGTVCTYRTAAGEQVQLDLVDEIPFGHKLAIRLLPFGANVLKYGEVIGRTSMAIQPGEHVHIHNVEGIRGRGDQPQEQQQQQQQQQQQLDESGGHV